MAVKFLAIRIRTLTVALTCLLAFSTQAFAAMTFIYPDDKTWVVRSDHFIIKLNTTEVTGVRVNVNNVPGDLLEVGTPEYRKAFRDMLILQPLWDPGKNQVVVEAFKGEERVETATAEIFYFVGNDLALIPTEYKPIALHTPEREKVCVHCHNMSAAATAGVEKESPCFTCHRKVLTTRYVHGPTGTYSCAYCHTGIGRMKYAVTRRGGALCYDCHTDKGAAFKGFKYPHGPVAAGMCEYCHDPHGSPYAMQLRGAVNDICLSCHESVRKGIHIVRTATGTGHILSGRPDPSKPGSGRDMSCVSCHDPHGGDVRYYFQSKTEDRMTLCQLCHNK